MITIKVLAILFWLAFAAFIVVSVWHSFFTNEDNDHFDP